MNTCAKKIINNYVKTSYRSNNAYALKRTRSQKFPSFDFYEENIRRIIGTQVVQENTKTMFLNLSQCNDKAHVYLNRCNKTKELTLSSQIWFNEIKCTLWIDNVKIIKKHKCTKHPYGIIYNDMGYYIYNCLNEFKDAMNDIYL